MKMLNNHSAGVLFLVSFVLSLYGAPNVLAATTPSLEAATNYGVLADTYTNTVGGTTISGDVGFTTGPAVVPGGVHTNYGSGAPYATAGIDQGSALSDLAAQPCTFTFAPGAINLSTDTTHGPIGVYAPGVYCSSGAMDVGGPLELSGSGTYIFRPDGALTSTAGAVVTLTGSSACDIFWTPTQATTLAANTTFAGTIIDNSGITVGANTTWTGRALAFGGTVTTDTDTISVPVCAVPQTSGGRGRQGTLNVVKTVVNDNGGTKTVADFPMFVNEMEVVSGETNTFPAGSYSVTETSNVNYTQTFSGDCDSAGLVNIDRGENKFCIVTNNDIGPALTVPPVPPLISVVKVPSPLALPNGPGIVLYTYTLKNIGKVTVTDITMVGDSCTPLDFISGDLNNNNQLEVRETWIYRCSTRISETHTNTVVATGWANGLSVVDIASATVVVGEPIVPPLIHVTKVPRPLTLPAGGGMVLYMERITNPGTVPLSNVRLTDDKCAPLRYLGGDRNRDSMLDPNERWTYSCRTRLTETTTNTAIARGEANGITVRDFAIVTVVVATPVPTRPAAPVAPVPTLPKTGFPPSETHSAWERYLRLFVPLLSR